MAHGVHVGINENDEFIADYLLFILKYCLCSDRRAHGPMRGDSGAVGGAMGGAGCRLTG